MVAIWWGGNENRAAFWVVSFGVFLFVFLQLLDRSLNLSDAPVTWLSSCIISWCNYYRGWCRGVRRIWGVRALDWWACRREGEHLGRGMSVCGTLYCIWTVGNRMLFTEKEWKEGFAATSLSFIFAWKAITLSSFMGAWYLLIWIQYLIMLLDWTLLGFGFPDVKSERNA